jgi:glycine/D-amino acid oxidase-like deaminating enzyme
VELFERDALAGAASGRNSGAVQHPFDPELGELHVETLRHYRELEGFALPDEPPGLLLLARERAPLASAAAELAAAQPELGARLLEPDELRRLEPALAEGLWGCRLATGYPVRPAAATLAFAERARRAGALLHEGRPASAWIEDRRVCGIVEGGRRRDAGAVLVAAGPWTPAVVDPTGGWRPIVAVWGVVVEVAIQDPPCHVVEEAGVEEVGAEAATASLFSLVAAGGAISVGSTFLAEEPDPTGWAEPLRRAGEPFVPALGGARVEGIRACPRPQSLDGRPLIGPAPAAEGLWIAAGHGPWGISTGPASARLAADAILGRTRVPAALQASRFS